MQLSAALPSTHKATEEVSPVVWLDWIGTSTRGRPELALKSPR